MKMLETRMAVRERERERALFSQLKIDYVVRFIGVFSEQVRSTCKKSKLNMYRKTE